MTADVIQGSNGQIFIRSRLAALSWQMRRLIRMKIKVLSHMIKNLSFVNAQTNFFTAVIFKSATSYQQMFHIVIFLKG